MTPTHPYGTKSLFYLFVFLTAPLLPMFFFAVLFCVMLHLMFFNLLEFLKCICAIQWKFVISKHLILHKACIAVSHKSVVLSTGQFSIKVQITR